MAGGEKASARPDVDADAGTDASSRSSSSVSSSATAGTAEEVAGEPQRWRRWFPRGAGRGARVQAAAPAASGGAASRRRKAPTRARGSAATSDAGRDAATAGCARARGARRARWRNIARRERRRAAASAPTLEDAKRPANGSGWRVLPRNACHLDAFIAAIRCRVAAEREADSLISDDDARRGNHRVRREPTSPPAGRSRRESIAASHSRAGFAPPSHTASRRRRQRARLVALRARRSE